MANYYPSVFSFVYYFVTALYRKISEIALEICRQPGFLENFFIRILILKHGYNGKQQTFYTFFGKILMYF